MSCRFHRTFPNNQNSPTIVIEDLVVPSVALPVLFEFLLPKLHSRFWGGRGLATMPVPETTVHEHDSPVFREDQVGRTGKALVV